ncbi:MAG TPA: hypothetical protein VK179_04835 [Bacteroidales bacterium]|nr:hypothetical protein [Bacteroidales bacterium]
MKKLVLLTVMILGVIAVNAQTRTAVKISDLPKAISENMANNHKGFTAQEAFKIDTKNVISYEVIGKEGQKEMSLFYDKDGKFEREHSHPVTASAASRPSAASKSASTGKVKPLSKK